MNIPQGMSPSETKNFLQRQINMGRYMILGTVMITAVNILFLLFHVDFYITYSFAAAYYLVWLGKGFDNGFSYIWTENGIYVRTGLVMALVLLGALLLVWYLSRREDKWLKVSMAVLAADAVLLLVFSVIMMEEPLSCLWELVIHGAVIWEIGKALSARKQIVSVQAAPMEEAREPEPVS